MSFGAIRSYVHCASKQQKFLLNRKNRNEKVGKLQLASLQCSNNRITLILRCNDLAQVRLQRRNYQPVNAKFAGAPFRRPLFRAR